MILALLNNKVSAFGCWSTPQPHSGVLCTGLTNCQRRIRSRSSRARNHIDDLEAIDTPTNSKAGGSEADGGLPFQIQMEYNRQEFRF